MLNIGKYRILGYLLGLVSACYGTYEIYNQFGSDGSKSLSKKSEPSEEVAIEEKEIKQEEQSIPPINKPTEKVNKAKETEKNPESEQSKEEVVPKVQSSTTPEREKSQTLSNRAKEQRNSSILRTNFINEDGLIIIRDGTIGDQFKDYLIISTKDEEVWGKKLSFWKEDIRFYEERKKDGRDYTNTAPIGFILKSNQVLENKELQRRCYNAYSKKRGQWIDGVSTSGIKPPYNKVSLANTYWSIVWKYCGKPGQRQPDEWYAS